jgi:hypothetical protein
MTSDNICINQGKPIISVLFSIAGLIIHHSPWETATRTCDKILHTTLPMYGSLAVSSCNPAEMIMYTRN